MKLETNLKSGTTFHALRLHPHDDLKKSLQAYVKGSGIRAGAIVTCVGSLEQYHLRFANQKDGALKKGHFEILSLAGTISEERTHLHLSIADPQGHVVGGHLLDNNLIYTTAEIVIAELNDLVFSGKPDNTYGYHELHISQHK